LACSYETDVPRLHRENFVPFFRTFLEELARDSSPFRSFPDHKMVVFASCMTSSRYEDGRGRCGFGGVAGGKTADQRCDLFWSIRPSVMDNCIYYSVLLLLENARSLSAVFPVWPPCLFKRHRVFRPAGRFIWSFAFGGSAFLRRLTRLRVFFFFLGWSSING